MIVIGLKGFEIFWLSSKLLLILTTEIPSVINYNFSVMEIIEKLEATKAATLAYYGSDDERLDKCYGAGKWTVRYLLHHLADAETILYDRIKRVISEPRQVLWAFDESAWAKELDYANLPLELSKHIYSSVRDGIIYYARLHYESNGHLDFVHSAVGVRTLRQEFDKVAVHNEHHLKQIEIALDAF